MEIIGLQKTVISRLSFYFVSEIKNKSSVAYKKNKSKQISNHLDKEKGIK